MDTQEVSIPMNLFQRINEVRKEVTYIQKDKAVSTGGEGSYKAVTHDQVTALCRASMIKHGIVCVPSLVSSSMHPIEGTKRFRYEATYDFAFINIDDVQQLVTLRIEAHGIDSGDKAPGKVISYAKKYAMLKLFEIETGEDDESRYQKDEFDLAEWAGKLDEAKSRDVIEYIYFEAKKAAMAANDAPSLKVLGAKVKELLTKFPAKEEKANG